MAFPKQTTAPKRTAIYGGRECALHGAVAGTPRTNGAHCFKNSRGAASVVGARHCGLLRTISNRSTKGVTTQSRTFNRCAKRAIAPRDRSKRTGRNTGVRTDGRRFAGFTFFPDKWEADTAHLSDGAYRAYHKILCFMWRKGKDQSSMRNSEEALSVAIFGKKTRTSALRKVMSEIQNEDCPLLKVDGDWLVSGGLRKEYEKAIEANEKASKASGARWRGDEQAMLGSKADGHTPSTAPIPKPSNPQREIDKSPRFKRDDLKQPARDLHLASDVLKEMTDAELEITRTKMEFRQYLRRPEWDAWLDAVLRKLFACGGAAAGLDVNDLLVEMAKSVDPRRKRDHTQQPIRDYELVLGKRITELCKRYGAKPWPNFPERNRKC